MNLHFGSELTVEKGLNQDLGEESPSPLSSDCRNITGKRSVQLHPSLIGMIDALEESAKLQKDGYLEISTLSGNQFQLFFRLGRLVWVSDLAGRFRRWDRLLRQFCAELAPQLRRLQAKQPDDLWEYKVLLKLSQKRCLERETFELLIRSNIVEVLFDLIYCSNEISDIQFFDQKKSILSSPICLFTVASTLDEATKQYQEWESAELLGFSPVWSPFICSYEALEQSVSAKTYNVIVQLIKGELSIRDLSLLLPGDLISIAQTLVSYEQKGYLEFCTLEDFPPPWPVVQKAEEQAPSEDMPLILCVDDNPRNCRELGKIVTSGGYRYLSIQDSVQALSFIIESQPDLLFIDLVMPVINGHELCSKVRKMSAFKDIPIIILTSNDGVVDRFRSKMTGATEFLSKPAQKTTVLSAIQGHLAYAAHSSQK